MSISYSGRATMTVTVPPGAPGTGTAICSVCTRTSAPESVVLLWRAYASVPRATATSSAPTRTGWASGATQRVPSG